MALLSDIIQRAFADLGVFTVGETIPTAIQTDALNRTNQLLDSLSAEGLVIPQQVAQSFQLAAGNAVYTLGAGGTFPTTGGLRAMKVTAWRATSGNMSRGGRALSMAEFGGASGTAQQELMGLFAQAASAGIIGAVPSPLATAIPHLVGADTAYPVINLRVFPVPTVFAGQLELHYWTPLANFTAVADAVSFPQGFQLLFQRLLVADLYSSYPSPSRAQLIFANAKDAKAALITENTMSAPQPQPSAPQGQQ